jgi:hypothetical protein
MLEIIANIIWLVVTNDNSGKGGTYRGDWPGSACSADRVGGGLSAPVLPHHRTCGSASGGSLRKLKLSLLIEQ